LVLNQYDQLPRKLRDAAGPTTIIRTCLDNPKSRPFRATSLDEEGQQHTGEATNFHIASDGTNVIVLWGKIIFPQFRRHKSWRANLRDLSTIKLVLVVVCPMVANTEVPLRQINASTKDNLGIPTNMLATTQPQAEKTLEGKPGQYADDFADAVSHYATDDLVPTGSYIAGPDDETMGVTPFQRALRAHHPLQKPSLTE